MADQDRAGMTNLDVALNKILAQEIMGWKGIRKDIVDVWVINDDEVMPMSEWNPIGNIAQAIMILEKLRRANGGDYSIIITELGDFWHVILGDEHRDPVHMSGFSKTLEWAICRVALRTLEKVYE